MSSCFCLRNSTPKETRCSKSVLALKGRESLRMGESYRSISGESWQPEIRECASYSMMLESASELQRPSGRRGS